MNSPLKNNQMGIIDVKKTVIKAENVIKQYIYFYDDVIQKYSFCGMCFKQNIYDTMNI